MQNAPLGLIIPAGAFFEKEFMMLLLFHPAAYYIQSMIPQRAFT